MPFKSRDVLRRLKRAGIVVRRQTGWHVVLRHPDGRQAYVPMHTKELPTGAFRSILKQTGLSEDEFREL